MSENQDTIAGVEEQAQPTAVQSVAEQTAVTPVAEQPVGVSPQPPQKDSSNIYKWLLFGLLGLLLIASLIGCGFFALNSFFKKDEITQIEKTDDEDFEAKRKEVEEREAAERDAEYERKKDTSAYVGDWKVIEAVDVGSNDAFPLTAITFEKSTFEMKFSGMDIGLEDDGSITLVAFTPVAEVVSISAFYGSYFSTIIEDEYDLYDIMDEKAHRRVDNGNPVFKVDGWVDGVMATYQGSTEMIDLFSYADVKMFLSQEKGDTWRLVQIFGGDMFEYRIEKVR